MNYSKVMFMLVGVPCSGKSRFIENSLNEDDRNRSVILSSDAYLIDKAIEEGKTYQEIFDIKAERDAAQAFLDKNLARAIENGYDIFWDQTNLTRKSRAAKLARIPDNYAKIALVFPIPPKEVLQGRMDGRETHTVPWDIVETMINSYQPVTSDEDFIGIIKISADGDLPSMPI